MGPWNFITAFTWAHHPSLSWAISIQFTHVQFPLVVLQQNISPSPKTCEIFRNIIKLLRWGVVTTSPNPQAGEPPLVGCPQLFIQYTRFYPPQGRLFAVKQRRNCLFDLRLQRQLWHKLDFSHYYSSLWCTYFLYPHCLHKHLLRSIERFKAAVEVLFFKTGTTLWGGPNFHWVCRHLQAEGAVSQRQNDPRWRKQNYRRIGGEHCKTRGNKRKLVARLC